MLFTALIVSIGLGASKQTVLLSSMSAGAIAAVVWMFRDWRRHASFWLTGFSFTVLHVAAIYFAQPSWVPTPTILLAPLFLLDFVIMAWVFPARRSGLPKPMRSPPHAGRAMSAFDPLRDVARLCECTLMTRCFAIWLTAFLLLACNAAESAKDKKRMDAIETRLRMPAGASGLDDYARYYGASDDGLVVGQLISRRFYKPDIPAYDLPVGKRRWLPHADYLPAISGGGCGVVTVRFDPKTKRIEAECNGDY
jgi:hypothetical protein